MANKYLNTAKKLQNAINVTFGLKLLINTTQWYSEEKRCLVTMYTLKQVTNNEKGKRANIDLFKTYSTIQLTLFLRDYWYELQGLEIPTDNAIWEGIKAKNVCT